MTQPDEPATQVQKRRSARVLQDVAPSNLPEIRNGVDLERMIDMGISALGIDDRVFQRAGQLVGVVKVPEGPSADTKIAREAGVPVIKPLAHATVRERLSTVAQWTKAKRKKGEDGAPDTFVLARVLPPEVVVSGVIARGEWSPIRPLVSVSSSPCLRPDGTVLQVSGYDPPTATLYWPREEYAEVPDAPKLEDARGAMGVLREVVCDFPFAKPEHESAWFAGLFTMLCRPAIAGPCPMFAVDATTRGTGKSRLVDAAVRLATGADAARTALPEEDDEMRKRISALMLEGDPAVCIDNITHAIALPSLDNVLTATVWKDRMLGTMTTITAPAKAVWWATGNNLVLGGDLSRRTIHIRLESQLENPEDRTGFSHPDLITWIGLERKKFVACVLTILRAFCIAGRPQGCPIWGSFEDWSRLVPQALVWVGMTNPMLAKATQAEGAEPELNAIRVFMHGFRGYLDEVGRESVSAREFLGHVYAEDSSNDLREAVDALVRASNGKQPTSLQVSGVLRRYRGRVIDRMRIASVGIDHHAKSAQWAVQRMGDESAAVTVAP